MSDGRFRPFFWTAALFLSQNLLNVLFPGTAPSFVLIAVIYFSMRNGGRFGLVLGLFAGTLTEIYGQGSLGFYMALWAAVGAVSGVAATQVFQDSLIAEILLPVFASYFMNLAELVYRQSAEEGGSFWPLIPHAFQPLTLAGTAAASVFLFSWLAKLPRHHRRRNLTAPARRAGGQH